MTSSSRTTLVHGKAVPETGQISIIEMDNPFKRELIWDPVAAGDWTFLGPSEYDSGFRIDLSQIARLNRPRRHSGIDFFVLKLGRVQMEHIDESCSESVPTAFVF